MGNAIFALFVAGNLSRLGWAPFAFLGTISYSLYLLHQSIGFSIIWNFERLGLSPSVAALIAAVLVTALATLLTFLVERPAMRLIRNAWKRQRA